jgi:hypothetical protein
MSRSSGRGLLDEAPSRVFRRRRGHIGFLAAADPRAAGGGAAAPAASFDQVRDRGDCRGWRRIGRTGQGERRCGGLLRRASGLGCLDGDEDRAADSECGRHVGSCRRDWVGDSNPLTPIIDFGHLVISAGPTAQFPPQFGR